MQEAMDKSYSELCKLKTLVERYEYLKTYSKIGDIENTIALDLVKASYKDGIVSLRYINKISDFVGTMQLSDSFSSKLVEDGYKLISEGATKNVYSNNKYKVVIMSEFDYLIVVMVKL